MLFFQGWLVRTRIASALGAIDSPEGTATLAKMLDQEREESVREAAALALGKQQHPRSIEPLGEFLAKVATRSSWIPERVVEVIDVLNRFSDDQARQGLLDFYRICTDDAQRDLRAHVAKHLVERPEASTHPEIRDIQRHLWRSDGRCEECGKKLGTSDKIFGKKRCKEHR